MDTVHYNEVAKVQTLVNFKLSILILSRAYLYSACRQILRITNFKIVLYLVFHSSSSPESRKKHKSKKSKRSR